ncbi:MAG: hypothetical protein M3014_05470, partial [Chloroflexota bacterium]|nr:hypothetical protein [Chloroflexota bacterium]
KLSAWWLPLYLFFLFRALQDVRHGSHGRTGETLQVSNDSPRTIGVPVSAPVDNPEGSAANPGDASPKGIRPATTIPDNVSDRPFVRDLSDRRWLHYGGLAVACLVATSLVDWQYVMLEVFATLFYALFLLLSGGTWRARLVPVYKSALIGSLFALIVLPMLRPMLQEARDSPWLAVGYESQNRALDLGDMLGTGLWNPGYLAYALAALGVVGALRARNKGLSLDGTLRKTALFWGAVTLIFYIISLGPTLYFNRTSTGVPLPYGLLGALPVFNIGRDPGRYSAVGMLGLATLSSVGLVYVTDLLGRAFFRDGRRSSAADPTSRPERRHRIGLLIAPISALLFTAISLAGFVVASGDVRVDPPLISPFFNRLAQDSESYAVLELPTFTEQGLGEDHYEMYQFVHNKARFGGRLARDHKLTNPNNFMKTASLFHNLFLLGYPAKVRSLYYPQRDFLQRTDYAAQGLAILNYYKVRYIILYKDALVDPWNEAEFQHVMSQMLGAPPRPAYEDSLLRAYAIPPAALPSNPLTLDVGNGWYGSEQRSDGVTYRWANRTGTQPSELYAMNLTSEPVSATLQFTAYAYKQDRTLFVALDGHAVTSLRLSAGAAPSSLSLPITVAPGNNLITFTSPELGVATGEPKDARLLSFGMYGVELKQVAK